MIFLPQRRRGAEGNEGRRRLLGRGAFDGKIKKPRVLSEAGLLKGYGSDLSLKKDSSLFSYALLGALAAVGDHKGQGAESHEGISGGLGNGVVQDNILSVLT